MTLDDRIPEMTDKELDNLRGNAERLATSGSPAQKAEAARLMPIIEAAAAARKISNASAAAEKKKVRAASMAEARVKKANARKAEAAGRAAI